VQMIVTPVDGADNLVDVSLVLAENAGIYGRQTQCTAKKKLLPSLFKAAEIISWD